MILFLLHQEEFHRVCMQLEALKERNVRLNNRHLVSRIAAMQEAAVVSTVQPSDNNYELLESRRDPKILVQAAQTIIQNIDPNFKLSMVSNPRNDLDINQFVESEEGFDSPGGNNDTLLNYEGYREALENTFRSLSVCGIKSNRSEENVSKCYADENTTNTIKRRRSTKSYYRKVDKSLCRCKSSTEGKLSDGIVMKPFINSIWPLSTEKIIVTNHCSSGVVVCNPPVLPNPSIEVSNTIEFSDKDATIQTSCQTSYGKENSTQTSNVDRFLSSSRSSILPNSLRRLSTICHKRKMSNGIEIAKPIFHSHSSFKYESNSAFDEHQRKIHKYSSMDSVRLYHSLENLDDSFCLDREGLLDHDRSSRSAQSTPNQMTRLRVIRDPDKARAFILYNLADRAKLSSEVTV